MFEPHPLNMTSRFTILYGTQDRLIMIALPVTNISNDIYNKIALLQYNETNLTIRNLEVKASKIQKYDAQYSIALPSKYPCKNSLQLLH